jgi:predicted cupin superfamily sugar epimerase
MDDAKQIINRLDLSPHPEGGYYRETYKSEQQVSLLKGKRRFAGTAIYFMLTEGELSNWHRVRWDELWHFYAGGQLVLEVIDKSGGLNKLKLSNDLKDDVEFQQLVPQHCWQRAYSSGDYSLVGCTVSPGFEFEDFEMIEPEQLAKTYPHIRDQILTNPV